MNISIKLKGIIIQNGCANTVVVAIVNFFVAYISIYAIGNDFSNASWIMREVVLVVFDCDPFIFTIASANFIDLPYGVIITFLDNNRILHIGDNLLLSIEQSYEFCMVFHYVSKHFIVIIYIHSRYWAILFKSDKSLIYTPFQEPIHHIFGNLWCVILTLYKAWVPSFIKNTL